MILSRVDSPEDFVIRDDFEIFFLIFYRPAPGPLSTAGLSDKT